MKDVDDATLVRQCLAGNDRAYAELLSRYRSRVFGLAIRMVQNESDAQDIAQEAFVKAFHSLASLTVSRSGLRSPKTKARTVQQGRR